MTLDAFRDALRDSTPQVRAYLIGKLMRQAKPDDVFSFVTLAEIGAAWPDVERHLGHTRRFWRWLLDQWGVALDGGR